jgi:signal transduction histidine kinase
MSRMSASAHRTIPSPDTVRFATNAVTRRRRTEQARELVGHGHSVQFYEDDRFLIETVVDFFAVGLVDGLGAVAIATREHIAAFTRGLHEKGFDVERTRTHGQLTLLDAEELLASFMVGALPDASRFRRAMDGVLGSHARFGDGARERRPVLAFGEMTDLLSRQGNIEGAIRLEELWNELAETYTFSLLCAYSLGAFSEDTHDAALRAICNQHAHVMPTERYMRVGDGARLREIALLQQRALALETELRRRRELEGELRDALRTAQAASRAKSDFLTVMSHELRTPLNAIAGHVQLIDMGLRGPVSEEQHEALDRVNRAQAHLLGLINDILTYAKVESGRVDYRVAPVDPALLIHEVCKLVEPQFKAKGLTLRVEEAPKAQRRLRVLADGDKLQQILLNLLSNALKFTPSPGEVRIASALDPTDSQRVRIEVRDTGVGIPATKLESIFEPFVQLGRGLASTHEGTGLGLSISRDLARAMGGDLTVISQDGDGSAFVVTMPRA